MSPALRAPCPAGLCDCRRDELLEMPGADLRILQLTREEERRLIERLERIDSLDDLQHLQRRMQALLGLDLSIAPGWNEVRSMRGFEIRLAEQPGLCRKTRQALPAAIRRGLERRPEIAWRLLDAHDLLHDS